MFGPASTQRGDLSPKFFVETFSLTYESACVTNVSGTPGWVVAVGVKLAVGSGVSVGVKVAVAVAVGNGVSVGV